ncbi:MAG: DUF4446 family protein [Actinobacteria bacterium]|nr:DUF4446 family protein [Actinomycetota bacterium]
MQYLLYFIIFLMIAWLGFISFRLLRIEKKLLALFPEDKEQDILDLLRDMIRYLKSYEKKIDDNTQMVDEIAKKVESSIQDIGVIRYDALKGIGGKLSFSIALLDKKKRGIVLSSINTRDTSRVYAKPVNSGGSKFFLSEEELKAIKNAVASSLDEEEDYRV